MVRCHSESRAYNLGNGKGYSVLQVIDAVERVTKTVITVEKTSKRSGDSAMLIADATHMREELGWNPQYPDLDTIIQHAWNLKKLNNEMVDQNDSVKTPPLSNPSPLIVYGTFFQQPSMSMSPE